MTTVPKLLIFLTILFWSSNAAKGDIATPGFGTTEQKFSLYGHTGQDPAPKRDEASWGGPSWTNEAVAKDPVPSKEELFSPMYEAKQTFSYDPTVHQVGPIELHFAQEHMRGVTAPTIPINGSVPTPPVSFLLVLGLLKQRRRVS
ncbi:MAG: hypothetical protein QGI78_03230 [Phycisphaerales bacterium]|jgi:hypothetical protein|nr:hypothetical protein [Phycisphaerales bacterium]